jgi:hypothetical protein
MKLNDDSLARMVQFARSYFKPVTTNQLEEAKERYGKENEAFNIWGPVLGEKDLEQLAGDDPNSVARRALDRLNSLRIVRHDINPANFASDPTNGYIAIIDKGHLGIAKA